MQDIDRASQPIRLFMAEDEALIAMLVKEELGRHGIDVVAVGTTVKQAIDLATTNEFDFAVLDINLNGKMSYPVGELLKARGKPFVFVTGYARDDMPDVLRGTPVLNKPYQIYDLIDAIESGVQFA